MNIKFKLPRDALYPQEFALTSPTTCGRSVGIVRSWAEATDCFLIFIIYIYSMV
jgi:hypothetical protein